MALEVPVEPLMALEVPVGILAAVLLMTLEAQEMELEAPEEHLVVPVPDQPEAPQMEVG